MIVYLDGYATALVNVTSDATGYFYWGGPSHTTNNNTSTVSVINQDNRSEITVASYPWTQEELDNAQW